MLDFLYTAVSWVLLRWHSAVHLLGLEPDRRPELGAVDRLPGRHRPAAAVPAVRQAGALPAPHAGDAAARSRSCGRSTRATGPSMQRADDGAAAGARASTRSPAACRCSCRSRSSSRCSTCCGTCRTRSTLCTTGQSTVRPADALHVHRDRDLRRGAGEAVRRAAGRRRCTTPHTMIDHARRRRRPAPASSRDPAGAHQRGGDLRHPAAGACRAATTTPDGHRGDRAEADACRHPDLGAGLRAVHFPLGVLLYWFTSNLWTMLPAGLHQPVPPARRPRRTPSRCGAEPARPCAPKPGQRPVRRRRAARHRRRADGRFDGRRTQPSPTDTGRDRRRGAAARGAAAGPAPAAGRAASGRRSKRPSQAKKRR